MKIGILAYHAAYNFGANLQIYSTVGYLKRMGYNPIVINWVSEDLENNYDREVPTQQASIHKLFLKDNLPVTDLCRNELEIAKVIEKENIEAVIVGSDAVAQHHPLLSRMVFPSRRIVSFSKNTSDREFPNPFWGSFLDHLTKKIPVAFLSASSQNSAFNLMGADTRKKMNNAIMQYSYVSVRDEWTRDMFKYITKGKVVPAVTPDPVFAFNYNCIENQLSKEYILEKYSLPEKYILVSFLDKKTVSKNWVKEFEVLANEKGITCVALPFPKGMLFDNDLEKRIDLPLSPLEWYALIKYSEGYVGHNMHPIIVSLHNSVPFFSFDNYGIINFRCFVNQKSSKIYHILKKAGFLSNRVSSAGDFFSCPSAKEVFDKIVSFDRIKCSQFVQSYYKEYEQMMRNLCEKIQ